MGHTEMGIGRQVFVGSANQAVVKTHMGNPRQQQPPGTSIRCRYVCEVELTQHVKHVYPQAKNAYTPV